MATAALIAGTVLSAGSAIQEGQVADAQGRASNDIAKLNAANKEREAASVMDATILGDSRQVRRSDMALGSQIAQAGANNTASDVDVLADTAFQFAMDRNLMLRQGLIQSQELLGQAGLLRAQGEFASKVGKSKKTFSYAKAGASILAGGYEGYNRGLFSGTGNGAGWSNWKNGASFRTTPRLSGGPVPW